MTCLARRYLEILERIKNGTATTEDVREINVLTELLGRKYYPLFLSSGQYLGLGSIKVPKLIIDFR